MTVFIISWFHLRHAPQYISQTMQQYAQKQAIELQHIKTGHPHPNVNIECHNRTVRYARLTKYLFK